MSAGVNFAVDNGLGNVITVLAHHDGPAGSYDTLRSVLVVLTSDTQTVGAITVHGTGAAGGWTAYDTYTAQGRKLWLYTKTCDATEPSSYDVALSPPIPSTVTVVTWLTDWAPTGIDGIRAVSYADAAGGTTLTLPSLTVTDAGTIWALVWTHPGAGAHGLKPQSPLVPTGVSLGSGASDYLEDASQGWCSSNPTGTRTYATDGAAVYDNAVGVMMIVGECIAPPAGGWGIGQVRMGLN